VRVISRVLDKVIKEHCGEMLPLHIEILSNWEYIVGSELADLTALDSLCRIPRENGYSITINVIGSASVLVRASELEILERLNSLTTKKKRFVKMNLKHCLKIERAA
jgi:hypothetical protein